DRAAMPTVRGATHALRASRSRLRGGLAQDAVRLVDEHAGRILMLKPGSARPRGERPDSSSRPDSSPRGPWSRWSSRVWRVLAAGLIVAGSLALVDAGVTLLWQEPISALYAKLQQDHLSGALRKAEGAALTPLERQALAGVADERARVAYLADELRRKASGGSAVGRIRIPSIGASFVVVKGTSTSELQSGPGVFPETGFPGSGGTTAIAGHRTTFLAPFRHIDSLRAGNRILLEMPYAHFTYRVIATRVVAPGDVGAAVDNVG